MHRINKIAFIIPYYGMLPPYFSHFVRSVTNQPFDIIFYSDITKPSPLPANFIWKSFSKKNLEDLFSKKLGITFTITNPYKICDLKPFYGFVFQEYLEGYQFWGTIDTDTVMGNFSKFINDEFLNEIDIYSGIKGYISGSLFLVRNNSYCNEIFKKSKDWMKILRTPSYSGFDECGGKFYEQLQAGESIFNLNTPIQSFTEVILLETRKGLRAVFRNDIFEPRGRTPVKVDDNFISHNNKEYLLLHFVYYKMKYYFYTKTSVLPAPYYIMEMGAFKHKPTPLSITFSSNFWAGMVMRKVQINLRKLKFN
jgi:hypothetical protein